MLRTALHGIKAHLGRLVATTLAVVSGIAFVAGTVIFADAVRAAYTDSLTEIAANVDVVVQPTDSGPLPASVLPTVRQLSDVASADGRMVTPLALLDRRGQPVTNFGAVGQVVSTDGEAGVRPYEVTGRAPGAGEALLDSDTATRLDYGIGDRITVADEDGERHGYIVVGLIDFGASAPYTGQSVVGLPSTVITELTGIEGYEEIVIRARAGVDPVALAQSVAGALGEGPRVLTGDEWRERLIDSAARWVEEFRFALLLFGVVALIVAAFVIYNTFAVLAAMRVRQTALLRCVGATRGHVFGATLLESVVIGLAGGVAGVLLGIGVAYALVELLRSTMDASIPVGAPVLGPGPVLVGLLVGPIVTVGAAFVPALRATRTSPVAALSDQPFAATRWRLRVVRVILAGLVAAAGIGVTVLGAANAQIEIGALLILVGGVVTFLGVLIGAPAFVGPLATVLGAVPSRLFGLPARLATANSRRNPGRTAITAATLMIGVGLMVVFSVVLSSISATASRTFAEHYPVDFVVTGVRHGADYPTLPPGYADAVRARTEFAAVARVRTAIVAIDGREIRIGAVDPASLGTLVTPSITEGSLADLGPGTAVVASSRTWYGSTPIGETLSVAGASSGLSLRVVARATTLVPGAGDVDLLVVWSDLEAIAGEVTDTAVLAKMAPDASASTARAALDSLTHRFPLVSIGSVAELSSEEESIVDTVLAIVAGLLVTTVLISLFGIANTLALSVVERTRESATIRALGLTRGQLRATLVLESMLMAGIGALVGTGLGVTFGVVMAQKLMSALNPVIAVPWAWFAGVILLAAVTALLAAVLPARRAATASIVAAMADT